MLTASPSLLSVGSAITALDYNTITLNKPTDLLCDYNSTLINKPSTFPADMTNIYTLTQVNDITGLTKYYDKSTSDGKYQPLLTTNPQ